MIADLKFAFRQLLKSPGFTIVSVLTLALGIGLNTSMFSLLDTLLLQPLPFPDKPHLVRIYRTTPQSQTANHTVPDYLELEREAADFATLAAYQAWGMTLEQPDRPSVNLIALRVTASFFPALGLQPELGRYFTADEDHPGNRAVMLSHATWQAQFGGDPAVIGRTVRIDGEPCTIVGVMPARFASVFLWGPAQAFRPYAFSDKERVDREDTRVQILGRYRIGLSLEQLNARFAALAVRLAPLRPSTQSEDGLRAVPLQSTVSNPATLGISLLLLGLAGFVLVIACSNLANLQLSRAIARAHEFAIRAALGASRRRLLLPLLCESVLLSVAGGGCGVLVAAWSNEWISSRLSANGFVAFTLELDWRVLSFALAVSLLTGIGFGLVPAWLMARVRVNDTLKTGTRGNTGGRAQNRMRHALIVAQFSLALVLLAGAGLFIRGMNRMLVRDLGWNHDGVLQVVLNLPEARYPTGAETLSFYTRLQERVAALPGVDDVAVGWTLPVFQFLTSRNYLVEGREPPAAGREPVANVNGVTPSFVPTLQIKLLAGRNFTAADDASAPPVAIISESMARALFPNEDPIGRRIGGLDPKNRGWMEIVGVMPDLRFAFSVTAPATRYQVFRPLAQETWNFVTVAVRTRDPAPLAEPLRRTVLELDSTLAIQQLGTVDQLIELGTGGLHMVNTILVAFALLGVFLAALGLYGVIARLVVQRTPEIGVRVALGAQSSDVVWLILRAGLTLTLVGTLIGLAGAFALGRLLAMATPELVSNDPLAIAAVTLLLGVIALAACWLPARKALRVNPIDALRAE
ncbi:ABC transporter permease [Opitutus terrae]|uniref:Permease n=1 Tax=Opitutus terrae (strain DSM 11246 / JCM 15787 / PB90-1) TaxID=452637 RepID=B1ZXV7_OPITP|nr:ABC transporter permease [Opitutus terrae]ACB75159.1 permease [Opitutus terrae PB90-1]